MVLIDRRGEIVKKIGELPPFSPVLNKLVATLANDNVSYLEIGKLIEQDTVLAGNVLRMVNSAAYNLRSQVTSIAYAVSILGLDKLRNLALAIAVTRMWSSSPPAPGWSAPRFNQHSLATAMLADAMALQLKVEYPEGAFLAGLMHDLGKLLVATSMPADYMDIEDEFKRSGKPWEECELFVLGLDHAGISSMALEQWKLPEPIVRAVRMHHQPEIITGGLVPLSLAVRVASDAVNHLGYQIRSSETVEDPKAGHAQALAALERIGAAPRAPKVLEAFQQEFEAVRGLF